MKANNLDKISAALLLRGLELRDRKKREKAIFMTGLCSAILLLVVVGTVATLVLLGKSSETISVAGSSLEERINPIEASAERSSENSAENTETSQEVAPEEPAPETAQNQASAERSSEKSVRTPVTHTVTVSTPPTSTPVYTGSTDSNSASSTSEFNLNSDAISAYFSGTVCAASEADFTAEDPCSEAESATPARGFILKNRYYLTNLGSVFYLGGSNVQFSYGSEVLYFNIDIIRYNSTPLTLEICAEYGLSCGSW